MARIVLDKVLRKKRMTKYRFAKNLGMDMKHTDRYFKPGINPTFKTLCRWSEAIGCRIRDLIEEDPPANSKVRDQLKK